MQTRLAEFIKHQPDHAEMDAILRNCVHCGFCNATCPTYQLLGDELDGPRGRIYLIKELLEGQKATALTRQHLDRCLSCRNCETTCPSGVHYSRLLDKGRELVAVQAPRNAWQTCFRRLLVAVLTRPRLLAPMLAFGQWLRPLIPTRWARRIPTVERAMRFSSMPQQARTVLLLDGCVQPVLAPSINAASTEVLAKFGITAIKPKTVGCCGALSYHLTLTEQSLKQIKANIDAWLPYLDQGVEAIVSNASGCGLMVKDYRAVLQYDSDYADKAERISAAVKDISEIIGAEEISVLTERRNKTVAFQSPCTLQHGQQLQGAVETILQQAGYSLTEVKNGHLCCGSAGAYSLLQRDIAEQLRQEKLSSLQAGAPDIIATANIGCLKHLQSTDGIPVVHWVQLLV